MCAYRGRSLDQVLQLGVAELEGDDVVQLVPLCVGRLVVAPPLGHGHLGALLRADVHHVHHASAPWRGEGGGGSQLLLGGSSPRWTWEGATRWCWYSKTQSSQLNEGKINS